MPWTIWKRRNSDALQSLDLGTIFSIISGKHGGVLFNRELMFYELAQTGELIHSAEFDK